MEKKISIIVVVLIVFGSGIIAFSLIENETQNTSKTKISDVIPGVTVAGGGSSILTTNIADIKDDILYTIEGEILEFGEPILRVSSQNLALAAIPVTMSVDSLHKGTLESDTFTFFLDSHVTLYPNRHFDGDEGVLGYMKNHLEMYPGIDYTNVPKSYQIQYHTDIFEIGDKIIAHIEIIKLPPPKYIYEKDHGTLDIFYGLGLGDWSYYHIKDGIAYGGEHHDTQIPLSRILTESLP